MILFYRGGWWGKCTSQLEGYQKYIDILKKVGVSVVAASVDNFISANEVAKGECYPVSKITKSYPIGYGVTKELATVLGSYWKKNMFKIRVIFSLLNFWLKVILEKLLPWVLVTVDWVNRCPWCSGICGGKREHERQCSPCMALGRWSTLRWRKIIKLSFRYEISLASRWSFIRSFSTVLAFWVKYNWLYI